MPPTAPQFNFYLWCWFFSGFDKIDNCWQEKKQMLFISKMTPKVLLTEVILLGHSYWWYTPPLTKKLWFLEIFGKKRVPIDDLGGQNLLPIDDFWPLTKNEDFHFLKLFPNTFIREMNQLCQNFGNLVFNWKMTSYDLTLGYAFMFLSQN